MNNVSSHQGTASRPSEPQRQCVGCRAKEPRSALLRIIAVDGVATPDPSRRLPGRGANVHRTAACIGRAAARGGLARALRVPQLQTAELLDWIRSAEELPPSPTGAGPSRARERTE